MVGGGGGGRVNQNRGWHSQWLVWVNSLVANSGGSSNVSNVLFKLFTDSSKTAQSQTQGRPPVDFLSYSPTQRVCV